MIRRIALTSALVILVAAGATVHGALRLSLPVRDGVHSLAGLADRVRIRFDETGAPHIEAARRDDAFAALGYVTAGDRLFQMDLLRRKSAGRLAEIFGPGLVASDRFSRTMDFPTLADAILASLPAEQKSALDAYARGVARAMSDALVKPWEFLALGYDPEPWSAHDSVLVALTFADMSATIERERAATVMRAALPETVVDFLTPESDCYNEALAPRAPARCAADAHPPQELWPLMRASAEPAPHDAPIIRPSASKGSNAWAVSRAKSADGRAILASDMHLSLEQPNVWYRAHLTYGGVTIEGLTYPGTPIVVAGSNGRVAWGLTNLDGDLTDLVRLRRADGTKYLTAEGPRDFTTRRERIGVRGEADRLIDVRDTVFGPVLPEPLLGGEVALRWTMLDPQATNFDLMNMDRAADVRSALRLLQGAGVPPLNAVVADASGSIGWTIMGRIPKRRGFSGRFAEYWDDGRSGWDGYFSGEELPVRVDPPEGFIASANQRMLGAGDFAPEIGHDYSGGFRAWRIAERLRASGSIVEADMGALQLDTSGDYYNYDRDVALEVLRAADRDAEMDDLIRALESWDGRAETDSRGLPLLLEFRASLADELLAPIFETCRALDPGFRYVWSNVDTPLRKMIDARRAADGSSGAWRALVLGALKRAAARVTAASGARPIADVRWGEVNRVAMAHPLAAASPLLASSANMPSAPLAGCPQCVRFSAPAEGNGLGANARLVVSPGHEHDGLLQMAGGQSGQIASPHYADQQSDWVAGHSRPLRPRRMASELVLMPEAHRGGE